MRYDSLPNSEKQAKDSLRVTSCFHIAPVLLLSLLFCLCCAGIDQSQSTFWSATQSLLVGYQGVNSAVNLRFNLRLTLTQPVINVLAHPLVLCQSEIESEIDR